MKSKLIYIAVILVLILSLVPVAASAPSVQADTMHVGAGQTYETIQAAIDAAADYDTILVYDGTYEENIFIDKPLTILSVNGSDTTIIDGTAGEDDPAVMILSSDVTFGAAGQGFGVTHQWSEWIEIDDPEHPDYPGYNEGTMIIAVVNMDDSTIAGVTLEGNFIDGPGVEIDGSGGIALGNMADDASLQDSLVTGNEVVNCNMGIVLINGGASTIYGNTIENNVVNMSGVPIGLVNFAPGEISENEILSNEIYNSGFGIFITGAGGSISGNLIHGNTIYDSGIGITVGDIAGIEGIESISGNIIEGNEVFNVAVGIAFMLVGSDSISGNTIKSNEIHSFQEHPMLPFGGWGIALVNFGDGAMNDNRLEGNTVYDWDIGVNLWNNGTGSLQDTWLYSNSVYNNSEGIYINNADYVYIYGNDIRDNYGTDTGIYIGNSDQIDIKCNNIASNNGCGVENDGSTNVDADDNWWGDPGGPGVNGSNAICGMTVDRWLSAEHVINTAADPASIPDGDDYSAVLSVEQLGGTDCCAASSVEADLGALLLKLLPADFEKRYVSTWSAPNQSAWGDWLDDLVKDMVYDSDSWSYDDFDLEDLLLNELWNVYEGGKVDFAVLISDELRTGSFQLPVYISGGCGTYFTSSIALTVTATPAVTLPFYLTADSSAGGSVTTPDEDGSPHSYDFREEVDIEATPGSCYHFVEWTGDIDTVADASAASTTIIMDDDYSITANFAIDEFDLTTSSTAGGSVTDPGEGDPVGTYDCGTVVNIVAEADPCYSFVNWTGDTDTIADVNSASTTITVDGDYSITANFAMDTFTLTYNARAGGSVTDPGEGTYTYNCGDVVDITATPASACYGFNGWTGDTGTIANPASASTTITMNDSCSINATFRYVCGGGGGYIPPEPAPDPASNLDVEVIDSQASAQIDDSGVVQEEINTASQDSSVAVSIPAGTTAFDAEGQPLSYIAVDTVSSYRAPPDNRTVVAAFDFQPDGATFDPAIQITLHYDPATLPEGTDESQLAIAFFNEATGEWEYIGGTVDTAANTITFYTTHFTLFGIIPPPVSSPAPGETPPATPTAPPATGTPEPLSLTIGLDRDSLTVEIPSGIEAVDPSGQPVDEITIETASTIPPVPEGFFLMQAFDFGPDGTTFSPSIEITMEYDLSQLPSGQELVIAYYNEAAGEWVFITGTVNTATGTINFSIEHFTIFAVLGHSATPIGGGSTATWIWILIGFIALLAGILLVGAVIRRRSVNCGKIQGLAGEC